MKMRFLHQIGLTALAVMALAGGAVWLTLAHAPVEEPGVLAVLVVAQCAVAAVVFVGALEGLARLRAARILRAQTAEDAEKSRRMSPHPFTHFVPSNDTTDVVDMFRRAPDAPNKDAEEAIYLAGDCTVFQPNHATADTMATLLSEALPGVHIINASATHYTILHAYNRLVYDLVRGYRPAKVVLFTGANDVLSFVHHQDGEVDLGHSHMYRPWMATGFAQASRAKSALVNYLMTRFGDQSEKPWDQLAIATADEFYGEASIETMRRIFTTAPFEACLKLFKAACDANGIELVLTTYFFLHEDGETDARKAYGWGIEKLNEVTRQFAADNGVLLADIAKDIAFTPGQDVMDKWQYTKSGNALRAQFLAKLLK